MRIAVLTTVLPSPRRTGGEVATQAVVDAMRRVGHDVTVVGYLRPGAAPAAGEVVVASRTIESEDARVAEKLAWASTASIAGLPLSAAKYAGAAYAKAARAAADDADVVVVDHVQAGWWIRDDTTLPPMVLVAHNVEAGVYADQAATARGIRRVVLRREHRRIAELERRLLARADDVWSFTVDERDHFDRGRVLPLPPTPSALGERAVTRDVTILGTWTWGPNAAGLRWFADHVLPRLETRDVHVGGAGGAWIADRPGATYHGRVDDAAAFLDSARVVAIPSTVGRGIQIKTLDALGTGAWVVATTVAVRGLAVEPPAARIATDAESFAAEVNALVADDRTVERNPDALAWAAPREEALGRVVADALSALQR